MDATIEADENMQAKAQMDKQIEANAQLIN
jgi:hypothetical protein